MITIRFLKLIKGTYFFKFRCLRNYQIRIYIKNKKSFDSLLNKYNLLYNKAFMGIGGV